MDKETKRKLIGALKIAAGVYMVIASDHWMANIFGVIIALSGLNEIE